MTAIVPLPEMHAPRACVMMLSCSIYVPLCALSMIVSRKTLGLLDCDRAKNESYAVYNKSMNYEHTIHTVVT